eukprot:jgi/Picre1/32139/NNA_007486.t1
MGHGHPNPKVEAAGGGLPRRAVQGPQGRAEGEQDILVITRPDVVESIHNAFLEAGATSLRPTRSMVPPSLRLTTPGPERGGGPDQPHRRPGGEEVTKAYMEAHPGATQRSVASRFDEVAQAYYEQAIALYDGGVDVFLVETIFDTGNARAALYALDKFFKEKGVRIPVFVSGTIVDNSGRTLSGQTNEAFWNSISHAKPYAVV